MCIFTAEFLAYMPGMKEIGNHSIQLTGGTPTAQIRLSAPAELKLSMSYPKADTLTTRPWTLYKYNRANKQNHIPKIQVTDTRPLIDNEAQPFLFTDAASIV